LPALPDTPNPYSALELVYRSLEAAEQAEVMSAALITDGNPLIPAALTAMTKGDDAVLVRLSPAEFEGTKRPITAVPQM